MNADIIDFVFKAARLNASVRSRFPKRKNIGKVKAATLRKVFIRCKGMCVNCGDKRRLTFDHIVPLSAGGFNTNINLQILCRACNLRKGAELPEDSDKRLAEQSKSLMAKAALKKANRQRLKARKKELLAMLSTPK